MEVTLAVLRPDGPDLFLPDSSEHGRRPRLVAVATVSPLPPENGFSLRVTNVLRELGKRWSITLVIPTLPDGEQYPPGLAGVEQVVAVPMPGRMTYLPSQFDVEPLRQQVDTLIREQRPAALLLWGGSEFLAFDRPDFPFVLADRIDCTTLTAWRAMRIAPTLRRRLSEVVDIASYGHYERRVGREADRVTVVGQSDAAAMRRLTGRDNVEVVSNGVSLPDDPAAFGTEYPEPTVTFTGVLGYPPNEDAAVFFTREVLPRIRHEVPDAVFLVAGRNPTAAVRALEAAPGVRVMADIADMREVLAGTWVAVAPMQSGSGVKNKVLEAWAMERPVVMTQLGANGLAMDAHASALVADDPATLARLIVELFQDGARRRAHGEAGRALVRRHHSWKEVGMRFDQLLRESLTGSGVAAPSPRAAHR